MTTESSHPPRPEPARSTTIFLPLALGAAVVLLWNTPLVYPFKVLSVMLHEMCHAIATLVTGGQVLEIRTRWDESGHTVTRGGWPVLIYPAGYLGTTVLGAAAVSIRGRRAQRLFMVCLGAAYTAIHLRYGSWTSADMWVGIAAGCALIGLSFASERLCDAAFNLVGVVLCLYTLHDVIGDLTGALAHQSDAGLLARHWGAAWLTRPIALTWVAISLVLLAAAVWRRLQAPSTV